jgi:uncharacterized protein YqeY
MSDATTLGSRLEQDQKDALRAGEKVRLGTIRRLRSALRNAEIERRGPLDEAAEARVLRSLARQHEESIEQFRAGGREDLVAREQEELGVLEAYLPAALDEAAVERAVAEAIAETGAEGPKDMGPVMKATMARLGPTADGKTVSAVARRLLGVA